MRNVRNFWLSADIDGRSTLLEGGPRSRDGGFDLDVYQRADGSVVKTLAVTGRAYKNGDVKLRIFPSTTVGCDARLHVEAGPNGEIVITSHRNSAED